MRPSQEEGKNVKQIGLSAAPMFSRHLFQPTIYAIPNGCMLTMEISDNFCISLDLTKGFFLKRVHDVGITNGDG